jgi:hypothetical protein
MNANGIGAPEVMQEPVSTQHAILRGALGAVNRIGVVAADISEREWRSPTHLEQRTEERIDSVARAAGINVRREPEYANGEPTGLMVVEVAADDYPAFLSVAHASRIRENRRRRTLHPDSYSSSERSCSGAISPATTSTPYHLRSRCFHGTAAVTASRTAQNNDGTSTEGCS